jgi:transcriptional regulator with XRE-family HTH domain
MASEPRRLSLDDEVTLTITLLRQVRGWNQDDLAKASGVGNSAISDYERSRKLPELATLGRLLDAMGFPLAAIDVTRQYVETLRAGGSTLSPIAPLPTTAPATPLHESAFAGRSIRPFPIWRGPSAAWSGSSSCSCCAARICESRGRLQETEIRVRSGRAGPAAPRPSAGFFQPSRGARLSRACPPSVFARAPANLKVLRARGGGPRYHKLAGRV